MCTHGLKGKESKENAVKHLLMISIIFLDNFLDSLDSFYNGIYNSFYISITYHYLIRIIYSFWTNVFITKMLKLEKRIDRLQKQV